jgi:hypothetical protein
VKSGWPPCGNPVGSLKAYAIIFAANSIRLVNITQLLHDSLTQRFWLGFLFFIHMN